MVVYHRTIHEQKGDLTIVAVVVATEEPAGTQFWPPGAHVGHHLVLRLACVEVDPVKVPVFELSCGSDRVGANLVRSGAKRVDFKLGFVVRGERLGELRQ